MSPPLCCAPGMDRRPSPATTNLSRRSHANPAIAFPDENAKCRFVKRHPLSDADIARFWSKVSIGEADECWPYMAGRNPRGYGIFHVGPRGAQDVMLANRVAYQIGNHRHLGSKNALHHCDNPPCCNPRHLYAGTHKDNAQDAVRRGRHSRQGKFNTHCKRGHEMAGDNLGIQRNGRRWCKECMNAPRRKSGAEKNGWAIGK